MTDENQDGLEASSSKTTPAANDATTKTICCPYCAEAILAAAKKCRHCGEFLDPVLRQAQTQKLETPTESDDDAPLRETHEEYAYSASYGQLPVKKVGYLLGLGILFMPYFFSWFTLQKGYSKATRAVAFGWMGIVLLVLAFSPNNRGSGAVSKPDAAPAASTCKSDWTKCTSNADLVNNYSNWSRVQVRCKRAAKEQARYGTPEFPWLPFGSYLVGDAYVKSGIAVAIEDDAQFQNGFGAMVHSNVRCEYDLRADTVISVTITAK